MTRVPPRKDYGDHVSLAFPIQIGYWCYTSPCFSEALERTAIASIKAPLPETQLNAASNNADGNSAVPRMHEKSTRGLNSSRPIRKRVSVFVRPMTRLIVLSTHPYGSCSKDVKLRAESVSPAHLNVKVRDSGV